MRSTTCTPSLAPAAEVGHTPYEIVRFNALKHGILSRYTVLSHENHADYESLVNSLMDEHLPAGATEQHLVEELASVIWRKRRVLQAEGFPRMRITLDVAGYRTRREKTLRQLAQSVATKVLESRRAYHFEPMSAMERRVVHMTISDIEGLVTESEGEGRKRHVVVFPERKKVPS